MLTTHALAGVAQSPVASPFASKVAQRAFDRFGPATIIGGKAPPTVFVVYTARGTFSSGVHAMPASTGVTPTVADHMKAIQQNPIQRGIQTSQTGANVPLRYNRHGQVINQVTLFQSGSTYQYATGQKLLI